MEMYQVRYFLAASRSLNFTRAAEECHVSQPALTTAIKKLEAELGNPLFHREGKRLLLTSFARKLRPHLLQIAEEADAARALAQRFRLLHDVPVRLGVMTTVGAARLSRFLAGLHDRHDSLEVAVEEGPVDTLVERLDAGEIDLAVINPPAGSERGLHLDPLYQEPYVVALPPEHHLAARPQIRLADLDGEAYVDRLACEMREMVMATCRDRKVSLYARFRSDREDWVQAMVLSRIGFAFMPAYAITLPAVVARPLVEPAVARTVALASKRGRRHSTGVRAFVEAARRYAWPG